MTADKKTLSTRDERECAAVDLGLELLERASAEDQAAKMRRWLRESYDHLNPVWKDCQSLVDFESSPLDDLVTAVLDFNEEKFREDLRQLGYEANEIEQLRDEHRELACAIDGDDLALGDAARIYKLHPLVRAGWHMLLVDGFVILREARWLAERSKYQDLRFCLRLLNKYYSVSRQKFEPKLHSSEGGKRSGETRRRRRMDDLKKAAKALNRLCEKDVYRRYTLSDIAKESGLTEQRLRKLGRQAIDVLASELRETDR